MTICRMNRWTKLILIQVLKKDADTGSQKVKDGQNFIECVLLKMGLVSLVIGL